MRCFVAIELPKEIKEYLFDLQKTLSGEDAKINWVAKKNFHLTLKFLGEIDDARVEEVKKRLEVIKFEPFNIKLNKIGFFPNEDYIRVIWVGLEPEEKIIGLQRQIDSLLMDLFPREQVFSAHLTLGRVKFIRDKKRFMSRVLGVNMAEFESEVIEFKLIKSELTKDGPWYE